MGTEQKENGGKPLQDIQSFLSLPAGASDDTSRYIRLGFIVLIIGLGGFLLWAAFAPLDEGVPCKGVVSIATKSKVVQHLRGGTVQAVHVQEGSNVENGEILITLDNKQTKARFEEVRQHYLGLRAAESRLVAEENGQGSISFHEDLLNDRDTILVKQMMKNQQEIFSARKRLRRILFEQRRGLVSLVEEGYAPREQLRDVQKQIAEMDAGTASELARVRLEVDADAEKSKALADELFKTEIRSPAKGQVVGLKVQTVGAVIQPGETLMSVVPQNEELLIEVKVAPHLIDRIHAGLLADVRFASFAHSPQLVAEGKVISVSQDLLTDSRINPQMPGASYYLALVSITKEGLKILGDRQMQPGMPAEVIIKTGERSFLTYLLHPLLKRMAASMKEE